MSIAKHVRCGRLPESAHRRRQSGQALAETLVACIVVIPFVLLIVLLGKFQSVQQATIAASRTLAFECTVRIDACEQNDPSLLDEIRQRHFGHPGLPLRTNARLTQADSPDQRHPLWVDRSGRSLLERFDDVHATLSAGELVGGIRYGESTASGTTQRAVALLGDPGERFGLRTRGGLFEATVQADLSARGGADSFLTQLDNLRIRPRARTAIAVDAWNASGPYGEDPHSVESRVAQGSRLNGLIEGAIDVAYLPVRLFIALMTLAQLEDRGGEFRYHEVDVDLVPADRIGQ
ncbi:MAG: hypothetical protein QM766_25390 [Burkholderiaceae bacterium]